MCLLSRRNSKFKSFHLIDDQSPPFFDFCHILFSTFLVKFSSVFGLLCHSRAVEEREDFLYEIQMRCDGNNSSFFNSIETQTQALNYSRDFMQINAHQI